MSRITFQMGVSALSHQKMLRSIELLGTQVVPIIKKEFAAAPAVRDHDPRTLDAEKRQPHPYSLSTLLTRSLRDAFGKDRAARGHRRVGALAS